MGNAEILLLALLLDAALGEPRTIWDRWPHPAIQMGRAIGWMDTRLNHAPNQFSKGAFTIFILIAISWTLGSLLAALPDFGLIEIALSAILLAYRSLVDHVADVKNALQIGLSEARKSVSMIVGRDTTELDESAVARAAVESAAENFSDGVVAPAFWCLLFGLPGILVYKMVNTADSMIGYRNTRYEAFGKAAARIDDAMNWIPARLTGALFCVTGRAQNAWTIMRREAPEHRSPNAGWPEAAMAASLDIALAGPRSYDGKMTSDSYINAEGRRTLTPDDITRAIALIQRSWRGIFIILGFFVLLKHL